jgi:YVTN family beta-propeller protein
MKIRNCIVGVILALHLGSASAFAQNAYITNSGSNTVSVLNTATGTVTATINVGSAPYGVAVSADGSKTYVTNQFANSVSAIDNTTETVIATITVGTRPSGVAITPDGSKVYVTNQFSDTVSAINTRTNAVTTIPIVCNPFGIPCNPFGVAMSPDGLKVYVGNGLSYISVIDTASNTVVSTIQIGNGILPIEGVTVSQDGSNLYVVNGRIVDSPQVVQNSVVQNSVSIIDAKVGTVKATFSVGVSPLGVAVSPDGSKIYVANTLSNTVSVIDAASQKVTAIAVGNSPSGVAFSTDGSKVYVANTSSNNVSEIDAATNAVTATFPVGNSPVAFGVFIQPRFAGTPGTPNCYGQSVAALAQQYGGLNAAAAVLGYSSVAELQNAIMEYCGG